MPESFTVDIAGAHESFSFMDIQSRKQHFTDDDERGGAKAACTFLMGIPKMGPLPPVDIEFVALH